MNQSSMSGLCATIFLVGLIMVDSLVVNSFPSMVFFENSSNTSAGVKDMHRDEVKNMGHYAIAIAGWGMDSLSAPVCRHEEEKLANISRLIKSGGSQTITAVYAGQFEFVDHCYDRQRAIIEDPKYDGFFLRDDDGKRVPGSKAPGNRGGESMPFWDFRNKSAVEYHTQMVAGYFADPVTGAGVDAVFFDEGDSFACQYRCEGVHKCQTMPNATAWHRGDIDAWVGAAKLMASVGKRAILSSQNTFEANAPLLWKEASGAGCPVKEDAIVARMQAEKVPYYRFYEYWLAPELWSGGKSNPTWLPGKVSKEPIWQYCRNQVANAIEEGKRAGVNFIAAGTSGAQQTGFGGEDRELALNYSLAGFLIAKSRTPSVGYPEYSVDIGVNWENFDDFFGFDHEFDGKIGKATCDHTRWGDCSSSWAEVKAAYERDYGVPLNDAVEVSPGRFTRQYTNVNLTFDCGKDAPSHAHYEWTEVKPTMQHTGSEHTDRVSISLSASDSAIDRPLTDLFKARGRGGGGALSPVSFWGPAILHTKQNTTLAFAQADRSPIGHDDYTQMRRSFDGGVTWEPAVDVFPGSPVGLYSETSGTIFIFTSLLIQPFSVSVLPCEADQPWTFNQTSGRLMQHRRMEWGPLGPSDCAKSGGKEGSLLGIGGLANCSAQSLRWELSSGGQLVHQSTGLCVTVPIDQWGYPLSALLKVCGDVTNSTASAGQRFRWNETTGMLKMTADMPRPGWCLAPRTARPAPLDPPNRQEKGHPPSRCHAAMMQACNSLRFRPSIAACNACLAANRANLTKSGCDDPANKDDVRYFCGSTPGPATVPRSQWKESYSTTIVTSVDEGKTWSKPRLINVTNTPWWNSAYAGGHLAHGIELRSASSKYRGRLVHASNYNPVPNDYSLHYLTSDFILYSDDQGVTWRAGDLLPQGWGESEVVEMRNGSLLLTARLSDGYLEMSPRLTRGFARSDDGGDSWAEWWYLEDRQPEIFTATCEASLASDPITGDIYFGHPGAKNGSRTNYTVHRSADGGATWEFMDRVTAHGSGYSDMHVIPTTGEGFVLAVLFQRTLWEAGIEGGGYNLAWATIPLQK